MATAVAPWPTSINVTNFSDYGEQWDTNFAEFAPDVGPPKRRRRMSLSSDTLSPVMYLTSAEVETFRTFYRTTIKDGTLPFTFPSPRTGIIEQYTFKGSAPQIKFADYGLWQVSMTWCSVPNTRASWLPLLTPTNALIPSIAPDSFADFTTEGSADPHYWYSGNRYASFATWLAAMGGTYSRAAGSATYFKSGLLQTSAATNVPRFPTDASGNATGLRLTSTTTEGALWNRDLTNAAWTKTNATAAKTQTGIDGVANSASLLTATAGNATVAQTTSFGSSSYIVGAWVKRITGTGTIQISIDGGSTLTTIVPTAAWQFFPISAAQTLANPQPLIKIVTSADAIAVDFVSLRAAATPTCDPIATTTTTAGQAGDVFSIPQTAVTLSALAITQNVLVNLANTDRVFSFNDAGESGLYVNNGTNKFGWFNGTSGVLSQTLANLSSLHKMMVAGSDGTTGGILGVDGTNTTISVTFDPTTHTLMRIGTDTTASINLCGDMCQFALWNSVVASAADVARLTT